MAKDLDDMIKKLNRIENHLAEEVTQDVERLFKVSVYQSLAKWYGDYHSSYDNIYNLMLITESACASGKRNLLSLSVDSGYMSNYPGWYNKELYASTAFDFMFMNGEHGHGRWQKAISSPSPYLYVDSQIQSGFDGKAYDIINKKISNILGK